MKFKLVLVTALLVPLGLVVAACGDGGSSSAAPAGAGESAAPAQDSGGSTAEEDATLIPMGSPVGESTKDLNITQIAAGTEQTQDLTRAVLQAGLLTTLRDGGPFTVFAPVDAAFAEIDPATLRSVVQDQAALADLLTLHVVPGKITSENLAKANGKSLTTVQGGKLKVVVKGEDITVGGAKVAVPDIMASNGVVHAVDTVILKADG